MRATLGPIILAGLFLAAGYGILHSIRPFPRRPGRASALTLLAAAGLAYLIGVSVLLLIAVAVLVARVALSFVAFALIALAVAAIGAFVGSRRTPAIDTQSRSPFLRIDRIVLLICAVAFGAYALISLPEYASAPTIEFDSWAIWTPKAIALFSFDTLDPRFWTSPTYASMHQEYPILLPMLESLHFRAIGRIDTQSVHDQLWLLFLTFPWTLAYLASRVGRAALWAPIALGAGSASAVITVMISGYADVPLVVFLSCGLLSLGLWVDHGDRTDLVLAAILLAGAAGIKQEGMIVSLLAFAVAGLVRLPDWRRLAEVAVAAIGFLVALLPWQLWVAGHEIQKEIEPGNALDPGFLADRVGRVWPSTEALFSELVDGTRWSLFVPLAILVAAFAIVNGRATRAAVFYLVTGIGAFSVLVGSLWIAPAPVSFYAVATAPRVVGVVAAVSIAALIHVAPRLAGAPRPNDKSAQDRHTAPNLRGASGTAKRADAPLAGRT